LAPSASVEIVFACDPHHREKGVAAGVGQGSAIRRGWDMSDREQTGQSDAYPFARGVHKNRRQIDSATGSIDVGGLCNRDLLAA